MFMMIHFNLNANVFRANAFKNESSQYRLLILNENISNRSFFSHVFACLCVALHQAEKVWWIQDEHEAGLWWWWWTPGRGYHRWRPSSEAQQCLGGFANKCACLIHMQSMQQSECVSWALRKLEGHPSLQGALNKVRNLYQQEGPACYEKYFGL